MASAQIEDLSRRLEEAAVLARRLGDEPVEPAESPGYLRQEEADEWAPVIERLAADDDPVTFVVGAGVSMEAGLPSWGELVRSLIEDAARDVASSERQAWIDAIESEGVVPAAAIVRVLLSEQRFRNRLWGHLYRGAGPNEFRPGQLAGQIAWFKQQFPNRTRVVTLNYDDLLEQALRALGLTAEARADGSPEPATRAYVRHLHGRLTSRVRDPELVLSESDYVRFQVAGAARWQDDYMERVLSDSLCVFVGLSFTDPNIIRWIYGHSRRRHLALFVRQGQPRLSAGLRPAIESATRRRWAAAKVDVVFTDFYGELAQLLHEAALRRLQTGATFHARAGRLRRRAIQRILPDGPVRLPRQQARVSEVLRDLIIFVRRAAASAGAQLDEEELGLSMWGLDHDRAEIALWASGDRTYTSQEAVVALPLEYASRWLAVEAATRCKPVERDPAVYASRWRYVRGIPLIWQRANRTERVPVGALTLTSRTPHEESALAALREGDKQAIDRVLHDAVIRLFG